MLGRQLEIQYFWPLTEQIPLDLDYTGCEKVKLSADISGYILSNANYGTIQIGNGGTGGTLTNTLIVDAPNVIWRTNKATWWRKLLFKLMDIKLEQR